MNNQQRIKIERLPLAILVAAIAAAGSPAGAQTAGAQTAGEADQAAAAAEQADGLADIVVTANRRAQNLQDVAMSVSALSEQDMEDFDVRSGADIVRLTPGVFVSSAAAGQMMQYSIRGVTQNDFNDIFEGPIAVYYDDTYVPSLQGQVFGTFDLQRVEVLKGPQGTLFGKNATGGLVHFIPNKPTSQAEGFFDLSYGRFNSVRGEGALSGPLSGTVRARASLLLSRQDDWLENIYPTGAVFPPPRPVAGEDLGGESTIAGRLQLEADLSGRLNVRLTGTLARTALGSAPYSSRNLLPVFNDAGQQIDTIVPPPGTPNFFGVVPPSGGSFKTSADFARDDGYHFRSYDASFHATHEFDGFDVVAVSSYKRFNKSIAVDIDGGAVNFLGLGTRNISNSFTQELRIAGETPGRIKWSTGALFSKVSARGAIGFLATPNSAYILFLDSFAGTSFASVGLDLINEVKFKNDNYSIFGQVDYPFTRKLTLVVGGRLIRERVRYDFQSTAYANEDDYEIDTNIAFFPLAPNYHGKENETLWAGKINLEYRTRDGSLLYAGVNRGVKGGAFNGKLPDFAPLAPDEIPYKPETLYSYEAGAKTSLLDGAVRLSAAAFYYDYKDYQAFRFQNFSGIVVNNDAETWGGELDADFRFSDRLRGGVALAYTKATIKDVVIEAANGIAPAIIGDRRPAFSPRVQASGNIAYEIPLAVSGKLTALLDASYVSDFYDNIRNYQGQRHDGYSLVNAGLAWASPDDSWQLKAYVRNLFEEKYIESAFDISNLCGCAETLFSKPRWWTVSLRKEF